MMSRFFNLNCLVLLGLMLGSNPASAFSTWGPRETFQTPIFGYDQLTQIQYPGVLWTIQFTGTGIDFASAPKNREEEYRWNTPVLYYAFDETFVRYFGTNGMRAVDEAVAILNGLTNFSSYSADLSEFPLDELRINYTASALHLFDLKSAALELLVERLGLANSERWTWTIRERNPIPGSQCPVFNFQIVQRNFDPVTLDYSKYVNGNLYTYQMLQFCPPDAFGTRSETIEVVVDPLSTYLSPVSAPKIIYPRTSYYGAFHTGLTRDDIGGLRYLMQHNNINTESGGPDTVTFVTNATPQFLFTSNLNQLVTASITNNAAALAALFPGLVIANTTAIFTNLVTTNTISYFTNYPFSPAGAPASLVTVSVVSSNFTTVFRHQFANVVTNTYFTNGLVTVLTTNVSAQACGPFAPVGMICTNVTTVTFTTNGVFGDYYLVPPNLCGYGIISTQGIIGSFVTNFTIVATNAAGTTNAENLVFSQTFLSPFNQYVFLVSPIDCVTNSVALRHGIDRIRFVRRDFDSLLGQFWEPTNSMYTLTAITNGGQIQQHVQRLVTQPDILFGADDLEEDADQYVRTVQRTEPVFDTAVPNSAPSGTILPGVRFDFNKVGPLYLNTGPFFADERSSIFYFQWASFDGSTNAPFLYPTNNINEILGQVLMQVTTPNVLPNGRVGVPYPPVALTGTGGQGPYSWKLAPGSLARPPGFTSILGDGSIPSAVITGTPTTVGDYNFTVRMTDANARAVDRTLSIRIDP